VLADFKPDVAVGVGGYASGPMLKQAQKKGIPTLLQEQNSYAGVTNKMLAKGAKAICTAYDGMERFFPADVIIKTGNPVRADILSCTLTQAEAKKALGFDPDKQLVLSVGGSLGARTVNQAISAALPLFAQHDVQVLWQTGKIYANDCATIASSFDNVHAQAFISDMAVAYRAADLVVSRAGAGTISELQLLGAATILVPSPNVAEDHQRKNALALVEKDAAVMILDADAVAQLGKTTIDLLADNNRRAAMSENIKKMALANAAQKIVDRLEQLI
jgi:UDP-N-acetylglucosamine--N-acetylmuramyl-(pentapeptide) pyrophosphoryl-undecaprenol N-acetylglucosamine transferase